MRGWSVALLGVACLGFGVAFGPLAAAADAEGALAAALAEQRALLGEAQALAGGADPLRTDYLDAFEASLIAQDLLAAQRALSVRRVAAAPAVSSAPRSGSEPRSERGRARLAQLAVSDAPEERVEREIEAVVREEPGVAARELVQDVLFRAVALTAVELRQQLDELRRSQAFQAAVRAQLRSLHAALASVSGGARAARDRELRQLERQLGGANERAGRASLDLAALVRDHEALFARLSRLGGRLYARARVALHEAGS